MKRFLIRLICTLCLAIITASIFQFHQSRISLMEPRQLDTLLFTTPSFITNTYFDEGSKLHDDQEFDMATSENNFMNTQIIIGKPLCPEVSPHLKGNNNITLEG